jgi:Na+-translocating ferredoxin:NAD+ oxidoreductase subunit C
MRGVQLNAHKESTSLPIATASRPMQLTLTASGQPLVRVGEHVLMGQQVIAPVSVDATCTHASVSGTVSHLHTDTQAVTIVIDNDGRDTYHPSMQPIMRFDALTPTDLRERIAHAGITGLGGAAFSTAAKLAAATVRQVPLLIVNGAECEPFITCDDALMREHAADVVLGTQALLYTSGATEAVIAIETNKPLAIAALADALAAHGNIRLQILPTFYPAGGERQLVKFITGHEVPSGKIPPDVGVLCHNVGTAAAIAQLITTGQPLIERLVTVTGSGVNQPQVLRARFGTPIASLINDCGGYVGQVERLVMGGPMMGIALDSDDTVVTAKTNCIIAATTKDLQPRGIEMPCIRCGDCAHACPAGLLPQQLLRYARLQDRAALTEFGLSDCIECGCCDYVCPSQIPLASLFVSAKVQP